MKPLNIGRLNRRITFLTAKETQNTINQTTQEWKEYKSVWATVKALRGSERYEAMKVQAQQIYKITTRYHDGITPDMRILFNGKIFEITSVNNVEEANYMLEMECTEYVEPGGEPIGELELGFERNG